MLKINAVSAFIDNYLWIIQNDNFHSSVSSGGFGKNKCFVVDPGDAKSVKKYLEKNSLELAGILITHQHADHIGGVGELLALHNDLPVYGPADITVVTHAVRENNSIDILGKHFEVIEVPGHTLNHLAYYGDKKLFCGDALFSAGCGRMFEGTPEMFLTSLNKLKSLPVDTEIYCAHEYTQFNLLFAQSIEPGNQDLLAYQKKVNTLRAEHKITLPSNIGIELKVNPFLRTNIAAVKSKARELLMLNQQAEITEVDTFAALREAKNNFL